MYVSKIHVVRFSSVGYNPFYFSIPGGFDRDVYYIQIKLKQSTVALRPVTIYGEEERTESILTREVAPNPLQGIQLGTLVGEARPVNPTLANPVSLLWDWFSKEGKERRKLKEGLYGEELEKFKRYCNLPQSFVLNASEYDFLLAVKTCYYQYKNQVN